MACNDVEYMGHVSDKLSELTQWSEQLRRNGAEEYRIDVEFCTAYYTGVRTAHSLCVLGQHHRAGLAASWCNARWHAGLPAMVCDHLLYLCAFHAHW